MIRSDRSDSVIPHLLSMVAERMASLMFAAGEELGKSLGKPLGKSLGSRLGIGLGYELGTSLGKALSKTALGEGVSTMTANGLGTGLAFDMGEAAGKLGSTEFDGGINPKQHALNTPLKSGQQMPTSALHAEY